MLRMFNARTYVHVPALAMRHSTTAAPAASSLAVSGSQPIFFFAVIKLRTQ